MGPFEKVAIRKSVVIYELGNRFISGHVFYRPLKNSIAGLRRVEPAFRLASKSFIEVPESASADGTNNAFTSFSAACLLVPMGR
jgi:hypothetical protein